MSSYKISIITPSFNQGEYIGETLSSIATQEYPNFEHIIYDGGSNDQTVDIINANEDNIYFWKSESDNGQSHAINKGLQKATGDIFNWLNSDDLLAPDALNEIATGFKNSNTNIFIGKSIIFSKNKPDRKSNGTDIYPDSLAKTIGRARIDQPEHWWRKSVLDEIGPLNENLNYTMDRDWWVKYLLRFGLEGIVKSDKTLARFRHHEDSKTVSQAHQFSKERNAYYRSLALHYGFKEHANNLKSIFQASEIPMTNLPEKIDLEILDDAFHHFFALLCEEAYATGNHKLALKTAILIDENKLSPEDLSMLQRIRFRAKLPVQFIKTVKKISGRT